MKPLGLEKFCSTWPKCWLDISPCVIRQPEHLQAVVLSNATCTKRPDPDTVVLMAQWYGVSLDADTLPVVAQFPAGPRVRLKFTGPCLRA